MLAPWITGKPFEFEKGSAKLKKKIKLKKNRVYFDGNVKIVWRGMFLEARARVWFSIQTNQSLASDSGAAKRLEKSLWLEVLDKCNCLQCNTDILWKTRRCAYKIEEYEVLQNTFHFPENLFFNQYDFCDV